MPEQQATGKIYALYDQASKTVMYVGKTIDRIRVRANAHWSKSTNYKVLLWRHRLKEDGKKRFEVMEIESRIPEKELNDAEIFWIAYFRSIGAILLNIADGGPANCAEAIRSNRRNPKYWYVMCPDGNEIKISNLQAFCRERDLDGSSLYKAMSGKGGAWQHKGHRLRREGDPPFKEIKSARRCRGMGTDVCGVYVPPTKDYRGDCDFCGGPVIRKRWPKLAHMFCSRICWSRYFLRERYAKIEARKSGLSGISPIPV